MRARLVLPAPNTAFARRIYTYPPNSSIETHFISLIHASKSVLQLSQIHAQIVRLNLSSNSWLITQLISSFCLKKSVDYAYSIFHQVKDPNLPIFNALIRGLSENSKFNESILSFMHTLKSGIRPDRLTLPYVCKSVSAIVECGLGRTVHGLILKLGLEFDTFVLVSVVDMYVKVGSLDCALKVFDESPERNKLESILLWNVLINGCCKAGDLRKATELFEAMPDRNIGSWNSLIDGLMKNGEINRANELFSSMPDRNVVSWTTMVAGLSYNGNDEEALLKFFEMIEGGIKPNDISIVSALSACAKVGALEDGVRIQKHISNLGFYLNRRVGTAFVDMYAKCGDLHSASRVFGMLKEKDLHTWSVMIWGWAIHGCFELAVQYFEKMISTGIAPDGVVFLAILTSCSHSGKVDEGLRFFESMKLNYSIEPTIKHYALIVDLLGRAGRLDEALSSIQSMPLEPDIVIWGALFCACRTHKNVEMAEFASSKLLQLEANHPGGYVFLSNAYAGAGRWDDAERVRVLMKDKGVEKDPAWSYVELNGKLH